MSVPTFPCPSGEACSATDELFAIKTWLEYWLGTKCESRHSADVHGHINNTWAVVPIPDWDVKQKLQAIEIVLTRKRPEPESEAQSSPAPNLQGHAGFTLAADAFFKLWPGESRCDGEDPRMVILFDLIDKAAKAAMQEVNRG